MGKNSLAQIMNSPDIQGQDPWISGQRESKVAKVQAVTAKDLKQIKALLQSKINELMAEAGKTVIDMAGQEEKLPDLNDRASLESELNLEIRMRERERKLIVKMRETIERIDAGDYGICEECGEPIGVKRLMARPVTTYCIECKTREEKLQKLQGRTPELAPAFFGD
jgi:DnaK suppressor protein